MPIPTSALDEVEKMVATAGGYDLQDHSTTILPPVPIPTWTGFPVELREYTKHDPDGSKRVGHAAMLNPSHRQAARWIAQAVIDVKGAYNKADAQKLVKETLDASGFQFLVRGVHWEQMETSPDNVAYPFFDGVTVKLSTIPDGWVHGRDLTPTERDNAVKATRAQVSFTGKYARIQSSTREDYKANGGALPCDGDAWLDVVRQLYQAAWGNDRYELMTARAKAIL